MKALDGFLDKSLRESGLDSSNKKLSRESDLVLRKHFEEKQKMTVAMNYFAMACPIMPGFLLGAFMFLDFMDKGPDKNESLAKELARSREGLSQQLYLAAMREKAEMEKKKLGVAALPTLEGLPVAGVEKPKSKKKKENELLMEGKQTHRLSGPQLLTREQTDVHKIVKKKMALESHLDKMNQEQDFGGASRVSSQLQILDKALKKLGC